MHVLPLTSLPPRRRPPVVAAALLLVLGLPACGLKPLPAATGVEAGGTASAPAAQGAVDAPLLPADAAEAAETVPAAPRSEPATGRGSGRGSGASSPGPGLRPSPASTASGGTTTGIDDARKVIRIALHGGPTGSDDTTTRSAAEKYWQSGPGGQPRRLKNGYTVEPVSFNDGRNPDAARRACNEQAVTSFLVYGAGGTEQITACATSDVLRRGSVPYLSTGVSETGLASLSNYFATSPTFEQQAPLIVEAARDEGFFAGRWAIVAPDGSAQKAMAAALRDSKASFDPQADVFTVPAAPRDCSALGSRVRERGYSTVYFLTVQPAFFAQCVGVIGNGPTYTGPGATLGYSSVANLACSAAGGRLKAVYLHPVTGPDEAAERAPGQSFSSDGEYQVYSAMQTLENALNLVHGPLTRERFIQALRSAGVPDGIAPGAAYRGGPFGGKAAYALRARCGGTAATNVFTTLRRYDR